MHIFSNLFDKVLYMFGQVHCTSSGISGDTPKHVEFFIKLIWETVHLVGFYYKNISRCTVLWMSNTLNSLKQNFGSKLYCTLYFLY